MRPRRKQVSITFQSDRAKERLALLTRDGRSQAEVIEEALDRMALPQPGDEERAARVAEIKRLVAAIPEGSVLTMKEFDALEYDEHGNPR